MVRKILGSVVIAGILGILIFLQYGMRARQAAAQRPSQVTKQVGRTTEPTQHRLNLFGTQFRQFIKTRDDDVSVAIYDKRTGKTYSFHPNSVYCPASTIKVLILAETLKENDGNLTEEQQEQLTRMIENSDNDAATDLWEDDGGTAAMQRFMDQLGMSHTTANDHWGLTTTTASDMLKAMKLFACPNDILTNEERKYGLNLMEHVEADQQWGVSAGVDTNATVAIKDGWSPKTWSDWRINSLGYVDGDGRNYVIAVYTINNPTEQYGIDTIDDISKMIWNELQTK
ncbi:serine hydrolase [Alicyclobacillus shizuokensis]|uniref:serine hydrolase n=1 Tax=Alicyclobacillus shizuokensis TaxID=392014 RepID=UPI000832777B|nr:serine hydrolase [Alicyclobacillus shizuokensis]MCL6626994.1 class A beta-lactamase-related serine hydrolase [Alicyclobacillus shizuokensis]